MTVVLHDANVIRLIGACPVEDGEVLQQLLLAHPAAEIDWRKCEKAHTAIVQILLVAGRTLQGPPASPFLSEFIARALADRRPI